MRYDHEDDMYGYSPQRGDVSTAEYAYESGHTYSPQRGDVSITHNLVMLDNMYSPQRGDVSLSIKNCAR